MILTEAERAGRTSFGNFSRDGYVLTRNINLSAEVSLTKNKLFFLQYMELIIPGGLNLPSPYTCYETHTLQRYSGSFKALFRDDGKRECFRNAGLQRRVDAADRPRGA